ncbi:MULTISPECIES: SpoIIE family protein phosphatase [unclassified Aureimonas]|uniref:SpoIIE family protein phosphatase n=1 Tax=unclassified Aureimonas TaxID=2615206 RepID=UPI0006F2A002|nr:MULTISPECIES: SpoIIE family protein phosphatase [unclassified Aureimonas]KQT69064.1 hypothetical protein ASG54_05300 [Aureimonas sp. Leaf460]KQT69302.1 hypothetical protein ASG62_17905 [Aureimonas sp. Leaf427]
MRIAGAFRSLDPAEPCGDAFAWWSDGPLWTICLVDGLGHGPDAARASGMALAKADACRALSPEAIIAAVDGAIRNSRGAAMSVVRIDLAGRTLRFAGVGNVRMALVGEAVTRFEARPGIVGTGCRVAAANEAPFVEDDLLVLWTDGFPAHLEFGRDHRSRAGDPEALAEAVIESGRSGRDDAAIVCARLRRVPA